MTNTTALTGSGALSACHLLKCAILAVLASHSAPAERPRPSAGPFAPVDAGRAGRLSPRCSSTPMSVQAQFKGVGVFAAQPIKASSPTVLIPTLIP